MSGADVGALSLSSASPEETRAAAEKLARALKPLDLLCLFGTLGAGKTTFVQGLVKGLGYKGRATSPTFGLAREYRAPKLTLHHIDLYRLGSDQLGNVGLEDYFHDPRAACAVEWPEAGTLLLPEDRLELRIAQEGGGRRLDFAALGPRSRELLAVLAPAARS